jgi:NarL family two-component system response regulator LiaR
MLNRYCCGDGGFVSKVIRFLIVEDQDIAYVGLEAALGGFPQLELIGRADDGEKAVEMALQHKPDLIIMDIGLPRLDGIEATRKTCQACPNTKVLILSSREAVVDVLACFSAGAWGYCRKDATADQLYRAMLAIMSGKVSIEASIAAKILSSLRQHQSKSFLEENLGKQLNPSETELKIVALLADGADPATMATALGLSDDDLNQEQKNLKHTLAKFSALQ